MMTGAQYKASLKDGRRIYFRGERVADVVTHPTFAHQVEAAASGYDRDYRSEPGATSSFLSAPRSIEALREKSTADVDLLTSISTTCAMTLLTAADRIQKRRPQGSEAIHAYVRELQRRDLRIVECITDAKGDRSLPPAKQADPDAYLRVVERRRDGVVIRGAKLHIAVAPIAHEMMVIPTKAMKEDEGAYAIACGVALDTPGVKVINVGSTPAGLDPRDYPFTHEGFISHGFVIFDDVFVPNERVFLDGETEHAATFAHSLGLWIRAQGLAGMADEADMRVGFAQLIAEANGLEKVVHVKEKVAELVIHATLLRATLEASFARAQTLSDGTVIPDELYTNVGKYLGAAELSLMNRHLHDIAGGSTLTAPSTRDLENPETGELLKKYMVGKAGLGGEYRLKLFHAIRDMTASNTGTYRNLATLLGGGGLYAQRVVTRGRYDMARAKQLALAAAGLAGKAQGA
jgi:4-hydroxybutyryl-CoA dehydratase/vinylacetyl-CoA-Delta-isomerase